MPNVQSAKNLKELLMSRPTRLSPEAALELFRFSVEQLIKGLFPGIHPKTAATRALNIQAAVLEAILPKESPPATEEKT